MALEDDSAERGSGGASLAGYDYQIDVSVWLALDVVLAGKLAHELVLEPATEEDVEAQLLEHEPGRVASHASMGDYTLVVQVKLRTGDAWTAPGVKRLLEHGSESRLSAAERLKATGVRYLLVTSVGLNGGTRGLGVRRAGVWPKADRMPTSLVNALPPGSAGRVAIIGGQDEERVATDIERLLVQSFRVPFARWRECRAALREEARIRILQGGSGRWRREEIEAVIRAHEGYIASSPELDHYVYPTNWADLSTAMGDRSAALIVGQSGTGKTLATRKLFEELRDQIPGLKRVPIKLGPHQLRDDQTEGPVLYDVEDPWGRFDFDPASRPWNDQLAQILSKARPDRMVVATSRLDVAREAGALDSVKAFIIPLEAEHYGKRERARLYTSRVPGLPRDLQLLAANSQADVLSQLATPLEIQKFFDALPTIDRKSLQNPPGFVAEAIRRAHQDSIELTVREQIEQRDDVRAAAVIWGLLKAVDKVTGRLVRTLEDMLADRDPNMSRGISPLIEFFVAARNLRQVDDSVAYYHPRVEAGIEQALARHAPLVRQTLRRVVDILVSPDGPGQAWGAGVAARLLAAAAHKPDLSPTLAPTAAGRIDAWLAQQVAAVHGKDFEALLETAAASGSADSAVAELARYLRHRPDRSFGGLMRWGEPRKDEAWRERIRQDPATKPMLDRYVREVLPQARVSYPTSLVTKLERLAPGLTPAFLAAAETAVRYGVLSTDHVIAAGALRDREGFEHVIDRAIEVLTPSAADLAAAAKTRLDVVNGVYSEDYAEHLADNDEGYTAQQFLKAYAQKTRTTVGWRVLAQHRHRDRLRAEWFGELLREVERGTPDDEELEGAFAAGYGTVDEHLLWYVLCRHWRAIHLDPLRTRLLSFDLDPDVRQAALACLLERAPAEFAGLVDQLVAKGMTARLLEIALDLAVLGRRRALDGERHAAAAEAARLHLPRVFRNLGDAAVALAEERKPKLNADTVAVLATLRVNAEDIRRFRLQVDAHYPMSVEDDIHALLAHTDDADVAVEALQAAIRKGMAATVDQAINHRFADVSAAALTFVGESLAAPLPERLLAKAADTGSPVRKALTALLLAKPHAEHLPTLLKLAEDTWSASARYYGEDDHFPIAQAAVTAIAKLLPLSSEAERALYSLALETSDLTLLGAIFDLLAEHGGTKAQARLLEQAITPGRAHVRRAAASALLGASDHLAGSIIESIAPELLTSRADVIAATLAIIVAWRADPSAVRAAAERLAPHPERRVFILLMICAAKDRATDLPKALAALLPKGHPAVKWALTGKGPHPDDAMLSDLGSARACAAVLKYLTP
ncbi:hypothetical protein [Phenylobacterium kunshanense]|uniref:Uncharacterized protein n=1 Tax=Phenylobacterium kunshanense TaxID=1445034 RepID=A0A328BMY0_9CAUL|nr:hypothetical protein [Phenylobacterium kunshanense]RAK68710.1 hypothetical protein DJ019_01455 [Phenylobacterium kunshanense]